MRLTSIFILLVFIGSTAAAQMTERLETDRPDQTESPYIVPLHFFQGEFGFNLVNNKNDVRQLVLPNSLLKYGLTNRFELRLAISPYTEELQDISSKKKSFLLEPVELGTKIRLFEEKGLRPKTSLIVHIGLPFAGSHVFRSVPLVYAATFTLQNTLSEAVALGYNLGMGRGVDKTTAFFYTIAPGFSIGNGGMRMPKHLVRLPVNNRSTTSMAALPIILRPTQKLICLRALACSIPN